MIPRRLMRPFFGREDGQIIVLVAVSMALVMILAAIVVDAGHAFVEKHHLQNAVDAASLAAAASLPEHPGLTCDSTNISDPTACATIKSDAETYLALNGYPGVILMPCDRTGPHAPCYMTPYKGQPLVLIKLNADVSTFFGGIIGVSKLGLDASAAASATASTSTSISTGVTNPDLILDSTISGTTIDPLTVTGTTRPDQTITGTTTPDSTITGTTIAGTTIADTTIPGSTSPDQISVGTTDPGSSIQGTTIDPSILYGTSTNGVTNGGVGFAKSSACAAISYTGAGGGTLKLGSVETNGGFTVSGNGEATKIFYGSSNPACQKISGNGSVDNPIPFTPPVDWPLPPPNPAPPTGCQSTGTGSPGASWTSTHPQGVYCWSGSLSLSSNGKDWSGYTWYAPAISVSSNGQTFAPAPGQTTLFDAYSGDPTLQGSGSKATGNMFAPAGDAKVAGGSVGAGSGFFEAQTLSFSGNFSSFTGTGGLGGTPTVFPTTTIPGTTDPGRSIPGTTIPGTTIPGTVSGGSTSLGTTIPGSTSPGTVIPGTTTPDTVIPGTTIPARLLPARPRRTPPCRARPSLASRSPGRR